MLILSRNFWWRADGTCSLSRVCALISHFPEIKTRWPRSAISPLTHHIDVLTLTINVFSKIAGVWEAFSHSFLWGHFVSATSPACVSVECVCIASARVSDTITWLESSWNTGERILFSWIWIPHLLLYIMDGEPPASIPCTARKTIWSGREAIHKYTHKKLIQEKIFQMCN